MQKRIRILVFMLAVTLVAGAWAFAQDSAPSMTYDQALECVQKVLPSTLYATNEYLPTEESLGKIVTPTTVVKIKVGMPWVFNDEEAPFYNALEMGYYAEEGLEVELIEGGPGVDHMPLLGAGQDDFAVSAGGQSIPFGWASPTPLKTIAIGTTNKSGQYAYITTDPKLIGKKLTPNDLVDSTVYTQQGGSVYTQILLDQYNIPRNSVTIVDTAGFGPDSIMTDPNGVSNAFYTGWLTNQPRTIDAVGMKWNALRYSDFGYNEYTDVIVARPDTLATKEGQNLTRRFMRATYRGLVYMLEHPSKSADIAVKFSTGVQLTRKQALWRFDLQDKLNIIKGTDGSPLMQMDLKIWDQTVATLLQYGQIDIKCS